MAGVVLLAQEGPERPQPVGRAVAPVHLRGNLQLEVPAQVAQVRQHRRRTHPSQGGDLPGGQEVIPGPQHAEHRVVDVRGGAVHLRVHLWGRLRRARVLQGMADGRPDRLGDRRREHIADLPVAGRLAAAEAPAPVVLPALQPDHHLAGQPGRQRRVRVRSRRGIRDPDAVHAELGPGALGPGRA